MAAPDVHRNMKRKVYVVGVGMTKVNRVKTHYVDKANFIDYDCMVVTPVHCAFDLQLNDLYFN